ncbi:MAG: DUF6879 family protein [Candidatus Paceibacterota bacterium]
MTLLECLNNYENEAFRLETLPVYIVHEEMDLISSYLKTGNNEMSAGLNEYVSIHSDKVLNGKRHIRARVIPDPISDYFKFEVNVGYFNQSFAGFELVFMEQNDFNKLKDIQPSQNIFDYWLFDRTQLIKMIYSPSGEYLGHEFSTDKEEILYACEIRDAFINRGKTFSYLIDKYDILKN